jgi:acyl-coenzyme A synthetase/AMP-(fatty) acid ligase
MLALGRLGVTAVPLSPDTPPAALPTLLATHRIQAIVHDGRFAGAPVPAWQVGAASPVRPAVPFLPRRRSTLDTPRRTGRMLVLTSGSTGIPRAVQRRLPWRVMIGPVGTHLRLVPLRPGRPLVLAAPAHHGYGLAYLAAGLALGVPIVLAAGLSAAQTLDLALAHDVGVVVALPVQLRRLVAEAESRREEGVAVPRLRAIISGAEPLPPELHDRLVRVFGRVVYNLYGTTEAGWSAIATPADLSAAPGTVGRAPRGIRRSCRRGASVRSSWAGGRPRGRRWPPAISATSTRWAG